MKTSMLLSYKNREVPLNRLPRTYQITSLGPVPDWWAPVFWERQLEIRSQLRTIFQAQRRNGGMTALWLFFRLNRYEAREVETALEWMVADGVLIQDGHFYSLSGEVT